MFLQNALAMAILSRITTSGMAIIDELSELTISMKSRCVVPLLTTVENGGGAAGGSPALRSPVRRKGVKSYKENMYAIRTPIITANALRESDRYLPKSFHLPVNLLHF